MTDELSKVNEMNRLLREKLGTMTRFIIQKGYCPVCFRHFDNGDGQLVCKNCHVAWMAGKQ